MIAPRTQSWLLVGSFSLNLFFLGLLAAHSVHRRAERNMVEHVHPEHHPGSELDEVDGSMGPGPERRDRARSPGGPPGAEVLRDLIVAAGGRKDPRVAELWKKRRDGMGEKRRALMKAQRHINEALVAEPYDEKALELAFSELNEQTTMMQSAAQDAILQLARSLSAEERARLRTLLTKRRDRAPDLR